MGRVVVEYDLSFVSKFGEAVKSTEADAMKIAFKHCPSLVPEVFHAKSWPDYGHIDMTLVAGDRLELKWDSLDDGTKESVCRQTWDFVDQLRAMPCPPELKSLAQSTVDGSPTLDVFFEDLQDPSRPLKTDQDVRDRIYERYLHFAGRRYEHELPDMLPRSSQTVFTHADIAPRNIMIDDASKVTGIVDWEAAGWYPGYWEYAQILRPSLRGDWPKWMEKTAPKKWDLSGINAARRVLF
ncbi:kinase-like protein [Aspergillus filifer]